MNKPFKNHLALLVFVAAVSLLGAIFNSQPTFAAAGGAGSQTGGSLPGGPAHSRNGWGWYRYNLSSDRADFVNGGNWPYIANACSDYNYVIALTVLNPRGYKAIWNASDFAIGTGRQTYSNYRGDSGGVWVSWNAAWTLFNNLPYSERDGTNWVGTGSPVASWFCYEPKANWGTNGTSSVNLTTATAGDRLTWTHRLSHYGTTSSLNPVRSQVVISGGLMGGSWDGTQNVQVGVLQIGEVRAPTAYSVYDVQPSDVGKTLCQQLQWDPTNSSGGRDGRGANACVTIEYNYNLTPTISSNRNDAGPGDPIGITATVNNSGPTQTRNSQWDFSLIIVQQASSSSLIPGVGRSSSDPCAYYGGSGRSCQSAGSLTFENGGGSSGSQVFNTGTVQFARTDLVEDLPVGTEICYGFSVRAAASNDSRWAHAQVSCSVVSKRPVLQVIGGDLIVGRGAANTIISTNTKRSEGRLYGSWAQYGVVASGLIRGMASGSGYAGGTTLTGLCPVSILSFSNRTQSGTCSDVEVGNYTVASSRSSVAGLFPITSSTPQLSGSVDISSLAPGAIYTSAQPNLTLSATADISSGRWYVINAPNSTVTVARSGASPGIRYANGPYTGIAQLPQVIIIANNIIISDDVSQVDAWLIASGTGANGRLNTCGAGGVNESTLPNSSQCSTQLTINGPVISNHLLLRRTGGAGTRTASGDPAEVFNLRPDAYMWLANYRNETLKAKTVITSELPPRF